MEAVKTKLYVTEKAEYRSYFNRLTKIKCENTFELKLFFGVPVSASYSFSSVKEQSQ